MLGDHLVPLSPPSQLSTTIVQTAARSAEKAWSRNNNSVETHTRRETHHTKGLHCFSKLIRLLRYNTYLLASLHIIDTSESSSSYFYIDLNFVVRLTLPITPPPQQPTSHQRVNLIKHGLYRFQDHLVRRLVVGFDQWSSGSSHRYFP